MARESSPFDRPEPGTVLSLLAVLWILLCLAGAVWLGREVVRSLEEPWSAGIRAALVCILLLLAWGEYRAVFRRRWPAAMGMILVQSLLLGVGCYVGAMGIVVQFDDGAGAFGGVHLIALHVLGPIYLFLAATHMNAWCNTLERHISVRPFCNQCGYNLIGTIDAGKPLCPECGTPIPLEKTAVRRSIVRSEEA